MISTNPVYYLILTWYSIVYIAIAMFFTRKIMSIEKQGKTKQAWYWFIGAIIYFIAHMGGPILLISMLR